MLDETLNIKCSICGKTESKKWYMTVDKFICEECKEKENDLLARSL